MRVVNLAIRPSLEYNVRSDFKPSGHLLCALAKPSGHLQATLAGALSHVNWASKPLYVRLKAYLGHKLGLKHAYILKLRHKMLKLFCRGPVVFFSK